MTMQHQKLCCLARTRNPLTEAAEAHAERHHADRTARSLPHKLHGGKGGTPISEEMAISIVP